jgi:hypothetical protein
MSHFHSADDGSALSETPWCKALLPGPEILDSIDSIYFVRCSSKKEEKGEKRQSRNHNAEAHSKNDHRVKWGSVGH